MKNVTVRLSEEQVETLDSEASDLDLSHAEYIRDLIKKGRESDEIRREHAETQNKVAVLRQQLQAVNARQEDGGELVEYVERERELSANQERARFVARDVRDYADKAPAGLVVDSSTVKKVITAAEGNRPHTQTVARIMDFLADLGKDGVELTKRRGRKLVVFDREVADRLANHGRCDRGSADTPRDSVIGTV